MRDRLREAPQVLREPMLVEYILDRLREALGLEETDTIQALAGFVDLGVDSRMALELKERVEEDLRVSLETTALFDHPTPAGLAQFLAEVLFAPGTGATDPEDEMRRKLAQYGF
jgi:acyl carrier protein